MSSTEHATDDATDNTPEYVSRYMRHVSMSTMYESRGLRKTLHNSQDTSVGTLSVRTFREDTQTDSSRTKDPAMYALCTRDEPNARSIS